MLKEKFYTSVINFYKRCMDPTNKFVTSLVAAEGCYINTAHPDFLNGHKVRRPSGALHAQIDNICTLVHSLFRLWGS